MGTLQSRQARGFNFRALTAVTLLAAGSVTAVTGLWLSQVRRMPQLRGVHLATAVVFVAAALWHGSYNLKPLTRYLFARDGGGRWRVEAQVSLALVAVAVLIGLLWTPGRGR
jgi:hypothetical protein